MKTRRSVDFSFLILFFFSFAVHCFSFRWTCFKYCICVLKSQCLSCHGRCHSTIFIHMLKLLYAATKRAHWILTIQLNRFTRNDNQGKKHTHKRWISTVHSKRPNGTTVKCRKIFVCLLQTTNRHNFSFHVSKRKWCVKYTETICISSNPKSLNVCVFTTDWIGLENVFWCSFILMCM